MLEPAQENVAITENYTTSAPAATLPAQPLSALDQLIAFHEAVGKKDKEIRELLSVSQSRVRTARKKEFYSIQVAAILRQYQDRILTECTSMAERFDASAPPALDTLVDIHMNPLEKSSDRIKAASKIIDHAPCVPRPNLAIKNPTGDGGNTLHLTDSAVKNIAQAFNALGENLPVGLLEEKPVEAEVVETPKTDLEQAPIQTVQQHTPVETFAPDSIIVEAL